MNTEKRYGVRCLWTDGRRRYGKEKRSDSWFPALFDLEAEACEKAAENGLDGSSIYEAEVETIGI